MSGPAELSGAFGQYRVLKKIGAGGMGTVYLAEDSKLARRVALKVPNFSDGEDPAVIDRFYREARVAGGIDHPNVCPVFEVGEVNGVHYYTMPYIEGTALAQHIVIDQPWPVPRAARLIRELALTLDEMHTQGIVHRDLKPGNIMLRRSGTPVLLDFGLARVMAPHAKTIMSPGSMMGTPAYMPPEQIQGETRKMGPASDIYSLGIILYQLLTGGLPFEGDTWTILGRILTSPPRPLTDLRPDIDPGIAAVCMTAIAREPEERFASMNEFAEALEPFTGISTKELVLPASVTQPTPPLPETVAAPHWPAGAWAAVLVALLLTLGGVAGGVYYLGQGPLEDVQTRKNTKDGNQKGKKDNKEGKTDGPPPPAVSLGLLPPTALTVEPGQTRQVDLRLQRKQAAGAVEVRAEDIPKGLTIQPVRIAGGDSGKLQVIAGKDAIPAQYVVRLFLQAGDVKGEGRLSLTVAARRLRTERNSLGMVLVWLEPGIFRMGAAGPAEDGPSHEVTITRPFAIAAHEVTVGQFRAFVKAAGHITDAEKGDGGYGFDPKVGRVRRGKEFNWKNVGWEQTDRHPVVNVSWNDAVAFCQWLSRKEGKAYDLPTEAEWEYACRAGSTSRYCFGDDEEGLVRLGNVADATFARKIPGFLTVKGNDGYLFTAPVGSFAANAWGLYDLHGNVWEWCKDAPRVYTKDPARDPIGGAGENRAQRGGSWFDYPDNCRSSHRGSAPPTDRDAYKGFRVILRQGPP
jgi:eukaryotic-like serine/threonine-protein kinase